MGIVGYVFLVLFALLLLCSVFPTKGGPKIFVVLSGSMEPKIHPGSIVIINQQRDYEVGDVVTFGANTLKTIPTTHRIVEIKEVDGVKMYTTKGDANNSPDSATISKDTVRGKVFVSVPYVGYLLSAVKTKQGLVAIVIIGTIIVYSEVMRIQKEAKDLYRKRKEKYVKKDSDEKTPA